MLPIMCHIIHHLISLRYNTKDYCIQQAKLNLLQIGWKEALLPAPPQDEFRIGPVMQPKFLKTYFYAPSCIFHAFHASVNTFHTSGNTFYPSLNTFHASVDIFHTSVNTFHTSVNIFHASVNTFHASLNTFHASVNLMQGRHCSLPSNNI